MRYSNSPVLSHCRFLPGQAAWMLSLLCLLPADIGAAPYQGINDIIEASAPSDWRTPDPGYDYMRGPAIIECRPWDPSRYRL